MVPQASSRAARLAAILALVAASGCQPEIGDECATALDCSALGDRLCDATQPGGYCTIFNCESDTCPEEATCVVFRNQLDPACGPLDDAQSGRFAQTFCMRTCEEVSDCRSGYECARPIDRAARVIDFETDSDNPQDTKVCLAVSSQPDVPETPPNACSPGNPDDLVPYVPEPTTTSGGGMSQGGAGGTGGAGGLGGAGGTGGAGGAGGVGTGGTGGA